MLDLCWILLAALQLLAGSCAAPVSLDQVPRTTFVIALTAMMNRSRPTFPILPNGLARSVVRARFLAAPSPNVAITQPASLTKTQHRFIEAQRNQYASGIHMTHTHTRDCCILLHFQKVCVAFSKGLCCISSSRIGRTQVGHLQYRTTFYFKYFFVLGICGCEILTYPQVEAIITIPNSQIPSTPWCRSGASI